MTVHHGPPSELLLDYASGTLPEPLSLLVATQITLDPASRHQVRQFEEVGGALLEQAEPAPMAEDALDRVLARLDQDGDGVDRAGDGAGSAPARPETATDGAADVPAPLRAYLEGGFGEVSWHERGQNVAEFDLLPDYPGYKTRLLRITAGAKIPQHTHGGGEYTLVLAGSFTDQTGCYARGDVAVADPEVTHQPVAGRACDCICLAVTDAPLKMTGPLGRLLNYFVDM